MSRKIRENFLVTYGNQGLYPAGQPVYAGTPDGRGPSVLVNPGQAVLYDPATNLSLDPATWNKADNGRFVLGVGYDGLGHGYSTAIRKSFGEIMYGCHIKKVTADCATCGVPQILDVFVDKCISVDEPVSFSIKVRNGSTVDQFPYNQDPVYTYTASVPSELCNACDEPFDCHKLINVLRKQFIPESRLDRRKNLKVGSFPKQELPFDVVPLYNTSYQFCLTMAPNECQECAYVQGITGITIDGEATTFNHTVVNTNYTSFGQLNLVINQINAVLGDKGRATLLKATGACCPYQIEINTCLEVESLQTRTSAGVAADLEPCSTTNPFDPINFPADSYLCGAQGTSRTPTCGFRIIPKPVTFNHSCFINLALPRLLTNTVEVISGNPYGSKFPFYVKEVQAATIPRGLGVSWAVREYKADNGGTGRSHNNFNLKYGQLGLPGAQDRINAVVTDPSVDYDSVVFEHTYVDVPMAHIGDMMELFGRTILLVPHKDNTTKAALEAAINFYITKGDCNKLPAIDFCTP